MTPVKKVVKTTFNLPDNTVDALEAIAKKRGKTISQVIRTAIAIEIFFDELTERGSMILIQAKDGSVAQLTFK